LSGVLSILGGFDEVERPTAPDYGADNEPAPCGFATSRIVHAYAIAYLMSRLGADLLVDHTELYLVLALSQIRKILARGGWADS
jgi:hypothetical protein